MTKVTVLPGDGIGPDIVDATIKVLDHLDCDLDFEYAIAGGEALKQGLDLVPEETLAKIAENPVALKGPITTPIGRGFSSVNVSLRQHFDLFANVRPALSIPGATLRYTDIDILVVRENMEGLYSGVGHKRSEDGERAELTSVVTRKGSTRVIRHAFKLARQLKREKVTVVHKANIMKSTSGLFLEVAREVAKEFDDIEFEEMIVDNCAMQLVMNPHRFDVMVTTNLFGDILSDLCAGLVGGLGLAPGANIGDDRGIFEAVHGSAPDIAGKNIANPTALLLASAMMLDYLELNDASQRVRAAVRKVIGEGRTTTPDLGGSASTTDYTQALIDHL
ncbi:MAG: isocitrate dehydrogenase [Pseudomonadales bacterium]|nr:isocitrate dehydrogenase [Pseudomonadales bacterium]MBO6594421.1 isocitrate dehydrogenase [Pseudomonadales bacterium]MBO6655597.1 isocitrate dehydrogenase [Pseudomonadales bacterium]MBO6822018.1 isocitrate dehydrogenase [Pseudomonadales bacterium]